MVTSPEGQTGGHEPSLGWVRVRGPPRSVKFREAGPNFPVRRRGEDFSSRKIYHDHLSKISWVACEISRPPRLGGHRSNPPPLSLSA